METIFSITILLHIFYTTKKSAQLYYNINIQC